jgi:hypothetical protein
MLRKVKHNTGNEIMPAAAARIVSAFRRRPVDATILVSTIAPEIASPRTRVGDERLSEARSERAPLGFLLAMSIDAKGRWAYLSICTANPLVRRIESLEREASDDHEDGNLAPDSSAFRD